MEVP
jgi:hypothetical protein